MNNDDFEDRLREIPLGMPMPTLRERVLGRAKALRRQQRRGRWAKGILFGAAVLLAAINLFFERAHDARVSSLVSGSSAAPPTTAKAAWDAAALEMRVQLVNDLLRSNGS